MTGAGEPVGIPELPEIPRTLTDRPQARYPHWADPRRDTLSALWGGKFCGLCGLPVIRSDLAGPGAVVHAEQAAVLVPHNVDDDEVTARTREQHNHMTREVRQDGSCPACVLTLRRQGWTDFRQAMTRVYLPGGQVAHLRVAGFSVVGCDMARTDPRLPFAVDERWLGAGSQAEYDTAAALPTCRACAARLGIPAELVTAEDDACRDRDDHGRTP